jgi:ADP-ribose pyrophosphatase YjhB (NUDIX family)
MTFDINVYRTSYSLGVGGVVLYGDKVLLTRFAAGANAGEWAIPGGFVERSETIDKAVQREVLEEAGVQTEVRGLISVRHRIMPAENSTYFIFLLTAESDTTQPDGIEIDEARFFTFEEVQALPRLRTLSRLIIARVFENQTKLLAQLAHPDFSPDTFVLFT